MALAVLAALAIPIFGQQATEESAERGNLTSLNQSSPFWLDKIATNLFAILKIYIFAVALLSLIFIFIKMYIQRGVVILPFEISKRERLSGVALADQLTSELIRIQKIHTINFKEVFIPLSGRSFYSSKISSEQSFRNYEKVVPKGETLEFSMTDIGSIALGSNSLSLGNLIIAFKNICPGSKPVTTIRGSLQRYGPTIVLVAVLEGGGDVQSWTIKKCINNDQVISNSPKPGSQAELGEQLPEMIKDMAFMIAYDLQFNISSKTWEGLKYYTEALDAYRQYELTGNSDHLSRASDCSLMAIRSEKEFVKPIDLLRTLESHMLSIGRESDAIEFCKKTLELQPLSTYAWKNKGLTLHCRGKYDEAIEAYDEAIRLDPEHVNAWISKGAVLDEQGKYDEAIEVYEEAIRLDPEHINAWINKSNSSSHLGKYDEAIKACDKAIRLDPKIAMAWNNRADALNKKGKYDEAIKACDKAIRLDPKIAMAWNNRADALNKKGKYDEAIKACDKAIRLDPKNSSAWNNKGLALKALGRTSEANTAYAKAQELEL